MQTITINRKRVSLTGGLAMALMLALSPSLHAQSSPLTVQPSTGRVGVGNTNPGYPLDVTGTVNATSFRGDGSQLTNVTGALLNKVTANTTIVNTAVETTLYSFSVAGGTFSTNNVLRLTVQITDLDVQDGGSCVLRFKYGATTVASMTVDNNSTSNIANVKAFLTFTLAADGATNSQVGSALFHASLTSITSPLTGQGTSAVDSTAAQTLVVTADWNSAAPNSGITLGQAILEKLM